MSSLEARPRPEASPRPAVCILGMHRSGTSLVAGALRICGVDLGPDERMMHPKPDNPSGFWEHLDIHTINEHLLARLGGDWQEPGPVAAAWDSDPDLASFAERAQEVLARDFSGRQIWALKDPRLCLLLPFWQQFLPAARYVVCIRNPLDVALSLRRRNHLSTRKATRLWASYTASALLNTRGLPRLLSFTDRLLSEPWVELERLAAFLDLPRERILGCRPELERFLDRDLWHHSSHPDEALESEEVDTHCKLLYRAVLRQQSEESGVEIDDLAEVLTSALELEQTRALLAIRESELETARQELRHSEDRLFESRTRTANLESWLEERDGDIERQALELAKLEATVAELSDRLEAVTSSLGWQLLDRYREVKQKILSPGRTADRLYRRSAERWRRRLGRVKEEIPSRLGSSSAPFGEPASKVPDAAATTIAVQPVDPPPEWLEDPARPPVAIVVPNLNRRRYLEQCLSSVLAETDYPHYRVCVFDQGSTDGSREYLESLGDRIETILSPTNLGFVHANNIAMEAFAAWDVVFLNNDTRVTSGWLDRLVITAYAAPNIGLVGAKLIYPDGRLQEAGSQLFSDGSARAYGKYEEQGDPRFNQRREVDFCSASCLYVKRTVLDRVGGFDEEYAPYYYEDADLALKAWDAGFKVLYEPTAIVIHQEHGTTGKTAAREAMERNREHFVRRWQSALEQRPRSLWQVPAGDAEQVLVIGDIVPAPDRSAGGSRLYHLLRILAGRAEVTYAFLKDQMIGEYLRPLEREGVHVLYPGLGKAVDEYSLDLKAVLSHNRFDVVVCALHSVAEKYLGLVRERSPDSRIVVDTYDVHFLRELREAELRNDRELLSIATATREAELASYGRADLVVTVTEEDRDALLEQDPELEIAIIPTIHELGSKPVSREKRSDLLFVGGFSHQPNVDAVLYFCDEILPRALERLPDLRLHVVGNAPAPEILSLANRSVLIHGYVPHLDELLDSCLVSVAPIRYGSGMKGKIAEAMAHGLPVVTTSIGAEGMRLRDGEDALLAEDPRRFADRIVDLHEDETLWRRIAENARRRVEAEWTPAAVTPRVYAMLDSLARRG